MVVVGGIVAGGTILGAGISASGQKSAASDQEQAAQNQIQLQQYEFNQEMQMEQPWLQAGTGALANLQAGFANGGQFTQTFTPGDFTKSPEYQGYQFQQQQGNAALSARAAATGQTYSPGTTAALSQFNQGLSAESYQGWYDDAYNQWLNSQKQAIAGQETLAGYGQTATAESMTANQNATNNELTSLGNIGNAEASGAIGVSNAFGNATSGLSQNYLNAAMYNQMFGGGGAGSVAATSVSPGLMAGGMDASTGMFEDAGLATA